MRTPILETERLLLRPLTVHDAESAFANWTSDPAVARFMRWELHKSIAQTQAWLAAEQAAAEQDTVYSWGFVLKATGELIGSGGLVFVPQKGMYELGYNLMKKYWNQGLATEAAQKILDFGKNGLHQHQFYCCHAKDNPASGKVMRKVGFQYQHDGVYYSWDGTRRFEASEYLLTVTPEK